MIHLTQKLRKERGRTEQKPNRNVDKTNFSFLGIYLVILFTSCNISSC
eukprot:UN07088